jgi:hypothetical protein
VNLDSPLLAPLLDGLLEKHRIESFIETGTGYAVSLAWAYAKGLDCYSCDVEARQIQPAKLKCPNAHIFYLHSIPFLDLACHHVKGPALFWLDAHDAHPIHGEGPAWPLLDELAAIKTMRDGKDVILIDDTNDARFNLTAVVDPFIGTHQAHIHHGVLVLEPR